MWILTDFQLENWVKIHISNSITFCVVKAKGFLTTRFFCHSKLYVMSNFGDDRMSRKKNAKQKTFGTHLWRNKSVLFRIFFFFVRSLPNFDISYNLEYQKNVWSTNLLLLTEKIYWVWKMNFDRFSAWKWGQNSHFKLNNLLCSKEKSSLTTRFFCHSKLYFTLNFSGDRMSRLKCETKNFGTHLWVPKLFCFAFFFCLPDHYQTSK